MNHLCDQCELYMNACGGTFEVCFMMWVYSLMRIVDIRVMTRIVAPVHAMC